MRRVNAVNTHFFSQTRCGSIIQEFHLTKNTTFNLHKKKLYLYSFNMKVVGIETSGLLGSIAVCDGNTVVGKKTYGKALEAMAKRLFLLLNQSLTKSNGSRMILT